MQASRELTRKQEALISALLTMPQLIDAVRHVGISEVTAWRWLKQEAFATAYREARRAVIDQAIVQVQCATGAAVETLRQVMQDATASPSARVSAAKVMLDTAFKVVELEDLEARLRDLEDRLDGPTL